MVLALEVPVFRFLAHGFFRVCVLHERLPTVLDRDAPGTIEFYFNK